MLGTILCQAWSFPNGRAHKLWISDMRLKPGGVELQFQHPSEIYKRSFGCLPTTPKRNTWACQNACPALVLSICTGSIWRDVCDNIISASIEELIGPVVLEAKKFSRGSRSSNTQISFFLERERELVDHIEPTWVDLCVYLFHFFCIWLLHFLVTIAHALC